MPVLKPAETTETRPKTRHEKRYQVVLHDDPVTTIEFVIDILVRIFSKNRSQAARITWAVHRHGSTAVCVTSRTKAEAYVDSVKSLARPHGYPLTATIEPL